MHSRAPTRVPESADSLLQQWERHLAAFLAVTLAVAVILKFIASPQFGSMMFEYVLKFVPPFLDRPLSSILDFNGIGDPRGRVVNNFFTWINIHARKELMQLMPIHPALGINWLLYPLTLATFYAAVQRTSVGSRYAIMATLLYAASPGMLDTLIDYYLPGKALMNFWFSAGLYGATMFAPADRIQRPLLGALLLATSTFFGLLSDETAIFIPICVCLLFGWQILHGASARRNALLVISSFFVAVAAYSVVVLIVIPLANSALGQTPLDLLTSLLKGPYAALFGDKPRAVGGLLQYYSPFGLLETILSAHFVPGRIVAVAWTSDKPFLWFFQWSRHEQIALYCALAVIVFLQRSVHAGWKTWVMRVALCALVYILVQAVFIGALSGYVIESNYYAALASALLALLVGAIAAAPGRSHAVRVLSWVLVAYVISVQFSNMIDTARRHPYLGAKSLTWHDLRNIRDRMVHGEVDQTLADQPFPSRRFFYAFEMAAALESAKGHRIDFRPMADSQMGIVRYFDIDRWADPNIVRLPGTPPPPRNEAEAKAANLQPHPLHTNLFRTGSVRGELKDWGYQWRFDGHGAVTQKSWRFGLMRVWSAAGRVERRGAEICLVFAAESNTCFSSLYQQGEWLLAYADDGKFVTRFRWEP